jgi:hypothetical protein
MTAMDSEMMRIISGKLPKSAKTKKIYRNFRKMNDFLDNLGNDQHQKMLREISNDKLTPKKSDKIKESEIFDPESDPEPLFG